MGINFYRLSRASRSKNAKMHNSNMTTSLFTIYKRHLNLCQGFPIGLSLRLLLESSPPYIRIENEWTSPLSTPPTSTYWINFKIVSIYLYSQKVGISKYSCQKEYLGFPNQVPSWGFSTISLSITLDVRYLEYARNHGSSCCK